jgi:uncharacterized repeat protein (TIGR01451 family)
VLTCDFGVMQTGSSATVDMTVRGISGGPIKLQPTASAAEIETDTSNNSFSNSGVKIQEQVDLSASLSVPGPSINSGEPVEYVLTVSNAGTTLATGAGLETTFDSHDLYTLTASATPSADCPATSTTAGVWRCPLPAIPAGGSVEYRWRVTPVPGGARTPSALVRVNPENSVDSNATNNTSSKTTTVLAANDLSVTIAPSAATVTKDDQLTYVVAVTNNGLVSIDNVSAQITLSNLVTYVSATGATCNAAASVVTCSVGQLAATSRATFNVIARAITAGSASTSTQVSGANPDPHSANNSAAASVTVIEPPAPPPPPPSTGNSGGSGSSSNGGGGGGGGALDELMLFGLLLTLARRQLARKGTAEVRADYARRELAS